MLQQCLRSSKDKSDIILYYTPKNKLMVFEGLNKRKYVWIYKDKIHEIKVPTLDENKYSNISKYPS